MCGIAGLLGRFEAKAASRMGAALAHRGPDGEGVWRDDAAGLTLIHRRLSIIDLSSAAAQPMPSTEARKGKDGRYVVVFNGEIYNYKALVGYLNGTRWKGKFNPNSDTAVLAPLYDLEGPAMLDRLEGMFALAIWDKQTRTLFVARDHAGIKPLYYTQTPQGLAFASELKALVPVMKTRTPDTTAMAEYLTFLWTPSHRTMLEGVHKLRPGYYFLLSTNNYQLTTHRWYAPPQALLVQGVPHYDTTKTPAHLLKLFDAVVAEQCTSDVPVGAFLSGGVDSSAIVASMVATGNRPANTYCIGFEGEGMAAEGFDDDMTFAQGVAKHLDVPFTPITVNMESLLERLPTLPWMLDEPTADPAPLFVEDIAARAKADGIKVLLGGAGGDDVFSGYRRHQTARLRESLGYIGSQGAALLCQIAARGVGSNTSRRLTRLADLLSGSDARFLIHAFTTNSQPDAAMLLKSHTPTLQHSNTLAQAITETEGQTLLNRLLYAELFGFLPDHNLNYNDKAAMLAGVEGRVPFTDRRLMDFMADVNPNLKLLGGHGLRLYQTAPKWFLKEAMRDRLPLEVLTRSKAGFGAPIRRWLTHGKGKAMMDDALFASPFVAEHFDKPKLEAFWKQTVSGRTDGVYTCLAVAMMGWWWGDMGSSKC